MAPVTRDLDAYRADAEAFLEGIEDAWYRHHAGLTPELVVAPWYARYPHLAEVAGAEEMLAAADGGRDRRALARFAVDGAMGAATADLDAALARAEAEGVLTVGGERIGVREATGRLANEPDRDRRRDLEAASLAYVDAHLTPVLAEAWEARHALATRLGGGTYRGLYERLLDVDLVALAGQADRLLADTDDLYERAMDRVMRGELGLGLADATRADMPRLRRGAAHDEGFPAARMLPALARTLEGLGIDLAAQANVVLDAGARPGKSPRAFCSAVRVPDRVYLVINPVGGVDDFRALLHEAGHAEHYGGIAGRLPVERRRMVEGALTECFAFLFDGLPADPAWLGSVLGHPAEPGYLRYDAALRLWYHRRYAAKLRYELALHGGAGLGGMSARYADELSRATGLPWPDVTWLQDVDEGLYVADYLRAWALASGLAAHLRDRFGTRWFARRPAGAFLRELWLEGGGVDAAELAREIGLRELDLAVLGEDAARALG